MGKLATYLLKIFSPWLFKKIATGLHSWNAERKREKIMRQELQKAREAVTKQEKIDAARDIIDDFDM